MSNRWRLSFTCAGIRGCFNFWRLNCMLSGHVHTLGHIELTQICRYTGDKLIMILHAIQSPEVETSSYEGRTKSMFFGCEKNMTFFAKLDL